MFGAKVKRANIAAFEDSNRGYIINACIVFNEYMYIVYTKCSYIHLFYCSYVYIIYVCVCECLDGWYFTKWFNLKGELMMLCVDIPVEVQQIKLYI